jgi:hypothetical protein
VPTEVYFWLYLYLKDYIFNDPPLNGMVIGFATLWYIYIYVYIYMVVSIVMGGTPIAE